MNVVKGTTRVIVSIPLFGIVIKLPLIKVWSFVIKLLGCFKYKRSIIRWLSFYIKATVEYDAGLKGMLFKGIYANWCEFWFYQKTHNAFLQPTYFSFFGLLNIQKIGEPCLLDDRDLWSQLHTLTKGGVWKDNHHFINPKNFTIFNGKLKMLDYGSRGSREVVALHGAHIVENFDPAYSWEEVKKRLVSQQERKED